VEICQAGVMALFDIKSKDRFLLLEKLVKMGDQRGKKKNRQKKFAKMKLSIKKHIKSFPKHKSHFNLVNHPEKSYIDRVGIRNVSDMHDLYQIKYHEKPERQCKVSLYRKVFAGYNIGFVGGRTDECGVCKRATSEGTRSKRVFKEHLLQAKTARNAMKKRIETAPARTFVGQRDLKSVTDVPQLTHGEMHYKRALSCYTSIICDARTGEVNLYNWHEAEAHRGVNEMIQVRMNFIEAHRDQYDDYDFSEDNCSGQNKSRANPVADLYAIQNGLANSIITRFYETGHSFMPPDQCGGRINEQLRKHSSKIEIPDVAFRLMTRKKPSDFVRNRMKTDQWKDWWALAEEFARVLGRKSWHEDGTREDFHFLDTAIWKVTKEHPWKVFFKYSHLEAEPWQYLKVRFSPQKPLMKPTDLRPFNNAVGGVEIKMAKWKDLQQLLPFIKKENHAFYKNIRHDGIDTDELSDDERLEYAVNYRFKNEWLTEEQL
jgi:hypothetical protein